MALSTVCKVEFVSCTYKEGMKNWNNRNLTVCDWKLHNIQQLNNLRLPFHTSIKVECLTFYVKSLQWQLLLYNYNSITLTVSLKLTCFCHFYHQCRTKLSPKSCNADHLLSSFFFRRSSSNKVATCRLDMPLSVFFSRDLDLDFFLLCLWSESLSDLRDDFFLDFRCAECDSLLQIVPLRIIINTQKAPQGGCGHLRQHARLR